MKKELEEAEAQSRNDAHNEYLRNSVNDEEIARIVARWTGIPVAKLIEGEREKLLHLDDELHKRVIGQDEAVTEVTETILRSRAGIQTPAPHRILPIPRPYGCRQNRAGESLSAGPV